MLLANSELYFYLIHMTTQEGSVSFYLVDFKNKRKYPCWANQL